MRHDSGDYLNQGRRYLRAITAIEEYYSWLPYSSVVCKLVVGAIDCVMKEEITFEQENGMKAYEGLDNKPFPELFQKLNMAKEFPNLKSQILSWYYDDIPTFKEEELKTALNIVRGFIDE